MWERVKRSEIRIRPHNPIFWVPHFTETIRLSAMQLDLIAYREILSDKDLHTCTNEPSHEKTNIVDSA